LNYSAVSIANLALGRLGARNTITSLTDNSPNAVKVNAVWDHIIQEVLSERDWKFAKIRVNLQLAAGASFTGSIAANVLTVTAVASGAVLAGQIVNGPGVIYPTTITSQTGGTNGGVGTYTVDTAQTIGSEVLCGSVSAVYGFGYAWAMPSDFLRFVRPQKKPMDRNNWGWFWGPEGSGWYHHRDRPFWPYDYDYKVETLAIDGNKYVLTDYSGWKGPAKITYIRLITDYSQLMPGFVNALAFRLAGELSIAITEDKQKGQMMEQMYRGALNSAEAQNECMDLVSFDESGSESWAQAGRYVRWY
jgi:hypothetical protein